MKLICDLVNEGIIPPVIRDHAPIEKIIVHNETFHLDDVAFVALIKECVNPDVKVERAQRANFKINRIGKNTILADMGGVYDGEWYYDHHQLKGVNRSAVGLFWDDYGNKWYYDMTAFIIDINRHDTQSQNSMIGVLVASMNPEYDCRDELTWNIAFDNAVENVRVMIRTFIRSSINTRRCIAFIENECKIRNNVIYIPEYAGDYNIIPYIRQHPEIKATVCPLPEGKGKVQIRCRNNHHFPRSWDENKPTGILGSTLGGTVVVTSMICLDNTLKHII